MVLIQNIEYSISKGSSRIDSIKFKNSKAVTVSFVSCFFFDPKMCSPLLTASSSFILIYSKGLSINFSGLGAIHE